MTTGEEDIDGLGWIKIEYIPTIMEEGNINSYKYILWGIVEAQLNKDIPRLKKYPQIASYENKTIGELTGEDEEQPKDQQKDMIGLGSIEGGEQQPQTIAPTETSTSEAQGGADAISAGTEDF